MKAQELRIGNYVYFHTEGDLRASVTELGISGNVSVELLDYEEMLSTEQEDCEDNVTPILLTEEWLKKLGWEWDIFYQGYFGHNYTIYPNHECGYRISYCKTRHDFFAWEIQYVHQLQNLYFALTGKELTINN